MYVLIRIEKNETRYPWKVSKSKNKLKNFIKEKGYYYSKEERRYIDDDNCKVRGGSGNDYVINEIEEI